MEKTQQDIKAAVLAECERLWDLRVYSKKPTGSSWHPIANPLNFIDGIFPISVTPNDVDGARDGYKICPQLGHAMNFNPIELSQGLRSEHINWMLAYRLLGLEARDAVQAERERIQPVIDCIANTQFMYKCYLDSKDESNRFNLSESIGKLGRAKTAHQKGASNV